MLSRIHYDDLMTRARRKGRNHAGRAREYARVGAWLTKDYFGVVRWKLLRVVFYGLAHIAMKFAAMGIIFVGVKALAKELPASYPGRGLIAPDSPEFIILSVSVGVLLLIATAFFRYEVRRRAIRLGRKYEEYSARRLIQLASRLPDQRAGPANRIAAGGAMRQYAAYARNCGMTARQLTSLLPTVASFVAVSCVLLWLDFWLTITLAALALAAFIAQYPANHRTAKASYAMERTRRESGRRYTTLFRRLSLDPIPLALDGPVLNDLFRSGHIRDNLESFCTRAQGTEQAALVSRISSSVLLGLVIILLGVDIVQGERTWASVVVYLAAVRFALADFVSVCKIASTLIKYHAQISNYREFVTSALPALSGSDGPKEAPRWPIELRLPGLHEPSATLFAQPGDVLAVLMPIAARPLLPLLFAGVTGTDAGDRLEGPVLVGSELLAPEASLRANFGFPSELTGAAVKRAVAPFAPEDQELPRLPSGWLDRPFSQVGIVPDWWLAALHVAAVRARGRTLVAMDAGRLAGMAQRWQAACRAALDDRILLIIHSKPADVGLYGERAALLCDGQSLRGWLPLDGVVRTEALTRLFTDLMQAPLGAPVEVEDDELVA